MRTLILCSLVGLAASRPAADPQDDLLKALSKSELYLSAGLKQLTKAEEVPISAKFEMDGGKLSLSVYTAAKGLAIEAEHNELREYAGDPRSCPWTPSVEVFKDSEHVARASMHLTITALAKVSLADIVAKAEKERAGFVYSITPAIRGRQGVFVVLVASGGMSKELCYDSSGGLLR